MGLQSDVIGFRFGFGYEKGKRTLRAMSNEQFNNLDEEAEQAIYKHHDAVAINFFQLEIQNWTNLQKIIIEKSVEIETMKANRTPSAFREIFEGFTSGFGAQQKQDAKDFFTSMNNTIMNLIGYFSGAPRTTVTVPKPTPIPPNDPSVPPSFKNPPATNIPAPPRTTETQEDRDKHQITLLQQAIDANSGRVQTVSVKTRLAQDVQKIYTLRVAFKNKYGYWF